MSWSNRGSQGNIGSIPNALNGCGVDLSFNTGAKGAPFDPPSRPSHLHLDLGQLGQLWPDAFGRHLARPLTGALSCTRTSRTLVEAQHAYALGINDRVVGEDRSHIWQRV